MRYAKTYLLPQCLRLCLVGNSNQTVQTRGSRGEYLTGVGISLYPEYDTHPQCPLPDPCLSLGGHSIEAVRNSYVLLRRVRMSKSIHGIFDAASSLDDVLKLAEQPDVPDSMHGLPAWWDPTLHDAALLLHTTTRGIFALVSDRDGRDQGGAFHHKNIVDHIESSFVGDNNCVPSVIIDSCPSDDINSWVSNHAESFPSPSSIERRLVRICSQAVSSGLIKADDELFANIPMFDHGGWPRD
uniref:Uncharacterized protein n=1 Tax=Craspedostauros australis TaxID=1486917 RepID=A0A7R9ZJK7_9STRA|mmetsp:Transcript_12229/g.33643  ORF Transcript_12229/g.33643 Transcript_12229/m.33643 type:complete len:241 (+) Transcript_12229:1-723(+)